MQSSSSNYVASFLEKVCKEIRYKGIHRSIRRELTDHIEDQKSEYISQGMEEEAATLKAVQQMGDPYVVGRQLDKTHRPKTEWSILIIAALFVVVSGVIQYFFSQISEPYSEGMFLHFLMYAPIGIAAFALLYFFDYTWLGRHARHVFFILFAMTIAGGLVSTTKINGSYTFITYASLVLIPAFAGLVYSFRNKGYAGILYSSLCYAAAGVMFLMAPSFSSFALFTSCCLIIMTVAITKGYFGGKRLPSLLIAYAPASLVLLLSIFNMSAYHFARIQSFFDSSDTAGSGYQLATVRKLFASSQPMGEAALSGYADHLTLDRILPAWSTDLSLTYIIAKLGFIPGIALVSILLIFIARLLISVLKQKHAYGFLVSFAVCLALAGQIIIYILSNIGVMQAMSVPLPLISFGAAGFVANMALLGLLLSVHRRTNLVSGSLSS